MKDDFEFTLHSPLAKEDWAVLADYEHENSNSVTFQTPKGKHVKYIKADILDKIRAEIMDFEEDIFHSTKDYSDYAAVRHCVDIIDKYRKEAGNEV